MPESNPLIMAEVQQVLDKGFQRCLDLGKTMQDEIEKKYPGGQELLQHQSVDIKNLVSPFVNKFYEVLARTLFEVLRMLQPEHFADGRGVNLYLLPGYHSHLIHRRIFYRLQAKDGTYKNYGVGLYGDPLAAPEAVQMYHDCCHSRWYRYATMPPRTKDFLSAGPNLPPRAERFLPASPYHWFGFQQPRVSPDPYDLIGSLTFTTVPSVGERADFPHHKVLNLSDPTLSSREWGTKLANMLNNMPHKLNPEWEFPDRMEQAMRGPDSFEPQRERELRVVRGLLISLWMHSVFKSEPPDWWDVLNEEIERQQLTSMKAAIEAARADAIASDWGDKLSGRPVCRTWTTIGLHPLVAAAPPPLYGAHEDTVYGQTIGWATLLCSVPLDLNFIAVARQWIRMVYGMLRSVEVCGRLRNRAPLDRAAQALRTLPHDIHRFIEERVGAVLRDIDNNSQEAIAHREFVLHELQAQSALGYAICSAAPYPAKVGRLKTDMLKSLRVEDDILVAAFHQVATDIQRYGTRENVAHVLPHPASANLVVPPKTYATCLFLIGEMVRNYCEHGLQDEETELVIRRDERRLDVRLEGRVEGGRSPSGESFALLSNVLEILGIGKTDVRRIEADLYYWSIGLNLSE